MEHAAIEEHQVIERYLMGRLADSERELFEQHYLSCPQCLDRLALAEAIERGFKRAAGEEVARLAAARQLAFVAWLARLGRSRQAAVLGMALLVAILLPGGLALREIGQSERDLAATRSALEVERERAAAGSSQALAEAQRLREELEASRRDLAQEREAGARAAGELAAARAPQGNVPILFLDTERSGPSPGEPSFRLRLPRTPGWIVLVLEIDPPHHSPYRAVLRDSEGRELWRGAGLQLNELETLTLTLPSSLLAAGDYFLAVEGVVPDGASIAAGRFTFRVLPPG